jgi:hypothetical protein
MAIVFLVTSLFALALALLIRIQKPGLWRYLCAFLYMTVPRWLPQCRGRESADNSKHCPEKVSRDPRQSRREVGGFRRLGATFPGATSRTVPTEANLPARRRQSMPLATTGGALAPTRIKSPPHRTKPFESGRSSQPSATRHPISSGTSLAASFECQWPLEGTHQARSN